MIMEHERTTSYRRSRHDNPRGIENPGILARRHLPVQSQYMYLFPLSAKLATNLLVARMLRSLRSDGISLSIKYDREMIYLRAFTRR